MLCLLSISFFAASFWGFCLFSSFLYHHPIYIFLSFFFSRPSCFAFFLPVCFFPPPAPSPPPVPLPFPQWLSTQNTLPSSLHPLAATYQNSTSTQGNHAMPSCEFSNFSPSSIFLLLLSLSLSDFLLPLLLFFLLANPTKGKSDSFFVLASWENLLLPLLAPSGPLSMVHSSMFP